jgi:hypothetical protein
MSLPKWCFTLHEDVFAWLMQLRDSTHPGRFTFCYAGNLFFPSEKAGLDASALALKICYMIDALDRISSDDLARWTEFIRSFQKQKESIKFLGLKKLSGFFIDPVFVQQADKRQERFKRDIKTRRAVTRQACAALMCAGYGPRYPVLSIPSSVNQVQRYLASLDWKRDPWGAGSHTSHLIFLLKMNKDLFGMHEPYTELVPVVFEWLDQIRNPDNGSWYIENSSSEQKVNSAMKVLTAYAVLNRQIEQPEPLIDFCLGSASAKDGCHNADILFVLHYCHQYTDYRRRDIEKFCWKRLEIIEQFRKPDGGFSFYRDRSQTAIYGVPISKGLPESDIHGTTLFLWSLKMIANILGYAGEVPWNMPVN